MKRKIVVHGAGNIGMAFADGVRTNKLSNGQVMLIRKRDIFSKKEERLFDCTWNAGESTTEAGIVVLAVQPTQLEGLIKEIVGYNSYDQVKHPQVFISFVGGKSIEEIEGFFVKHNTKQESDPGHSKDLPIVRVMPNTALKVGESMTCLAFNKHAEKYKDEIVELFNHLGKTLVIDEKMFPQATVLCGSGTAIGAKFIRAFMQAGIQAGFNEHDSQLIATQVMKGVATLLQEKDSHPELVVDKVTTPGGCTITALAEMDHQGFTSAVLKSIEVGICKARGL